MANEKPRKSMGTTELEEKPFLDSLTPGKSEPKRAFGGNFVNPKDRVARVSGPMPKEETQSSPSGNLFSPDKSENYSIRDKAPMDRK
jgi:hypothetical protein